MTFYKINAVCLRSFLSYVIINYCLSHIKTLNMSMPIFKVFLSIIYYIASLNPQDNISFSFINFFCACCFIRFWYLKFYNIITTNFVFYRIHDFNHNNTPIILFYIKMVNFLIFTYLTLIVNK